MKVKTLRKKLEKFADNVEVVIDHDINGWYTLMGVEPSTFDGKIQHVNLITNNCENEDVN